MKSGILYGAGGQGWVKVARVRAILKMTAGFLKRSGKWLMLAGILGVGWVAWPVMAAEVKYALGQTGVGRAAVRMANVDTRLVVEPGSQRVADWKVPDANYSIYIPKILA